jgi:hypothetical protein
MTGTIEAIGDRVSPGRVVERRVARMRRSASNLGTRVMGVPRAAAGTVRGGAGTAVSGTHEAAAGMAGAVGDAPERAKEVAGSNPLAAGAVAFGIGVLLGSLAPPSRSERQIADAVVEPLKQELATAGREVADAVSDELQGDVAEMKEHAVAAAQELESHATEAAQRVRGGGAGT